MAASDERDHEIVHVERDPGDPMDTAAANARELRLIRAELDAKRSTTIPISWQHADGTATYIDSDGAVTRR